MKKKVFGIILLGLLLISFVSAGVFSDFFNRITGKATSDSSTSLNYAYEYKLVDLKTRPYGRPSCSCDLDPKIRDCPGIERGDMFNSSINDGRVCADYYLYGDKEKVKIALFRKKNKFIVEVPEQDQKNICEEININTLDISDNEQETDASVDVSRIDLSQLGENIVVDFYLQGEPIEFDGCYKLLIDEDKNTETGADFRLNLGVEHFITLCGDGTKWVYSIFSENYNEDKLISYSINDNKVSMVFQASLIKTNNFNWGFESFNNLGVDSNDYLYDFKILDSNISLRVRSDNLVIEDPYLISVPYQSTTKLNFEVINGDEITPLGVNDVEFNLGHPASHVIDNPDSIISIDSEGYAHYNGEGYISLSVSLKNCPLYSNQIILAGGDVYEYAKGNVIAVFPSEYFPEGSPFSFGDMFSNYPNYFKLVNLAYDTGSLLYNNFKPFNKQILAFLDIPNHCGGNNNPLEVSPCCYMDCGSGEPIYDVVVHEIGHNFADHSIGMNELLFSNNARINNAGFGECVASLSVQYLRAKILESPEKYGFTQNDYEYFNWADSQIEDNEGNKRTLERFEQFIDQGDITGIFDFEDLLTEEQKQPLGGNVGVFCSFFVTPAAYPQEFNNSNSWDFYEKFLNIFGNNKLPNFQEEKIETYFATAYSVAIGSDMRSKLRYWGFTIDNNYYEELYPILEDLTREDEESEGEILSECEERGYVCQSFCEQGSEEIPYVCDGLESCCATYVTPPEPEIELSECEERGYVCQSFCEQGSEEIPDVCDGLESCCATYVTPPEPSTWDLFWCRLKNSFNRERYEQCLAS